MTGREKDLAICQINTLAIIYAGGGMSLETAIRELSLDNKECLRLAEAENPDMAQKIRSLLWQPEKSLKKNTIGLIKGSSQCFYL